jgi:AcrR family transcriptional regulator
MYDSARVLHLSKFGKGAYTKGMYDPDKYNAKAVRAKPSQARGKERVRVILAAALELFKERGLESVTTNDIARRAVIPIGSLYRYYPNKDSIIVALTELYIDDISHIFKDIGKHPMLPYLSWDEVLLLMVDGWVNYAKLNSCFPLLYVVRANPELRKRNRQALAEFTQAFTAVLKKRCPDVSIRQALICFNLCLAAVEMGTSEEYERLGSHVMFHEAVGVVSAHMLHTCMQHYHPTS